MQNGRTSTAGWAKGFRAEARTAAPIRRYDAAAGGKDFSPFSPKTIFRASPTSETAAGGDPDGRSKNHGAPIRTQRMRTQRRLSLRIFAIPGLAANSPTL
jgi:hypothetical protein